MLSAIKRFERRRNRARTYIKSLRYKGCDSPRVSVFRSNQFFYAQVIDVQGHVLLSASSSDKTILDQCRKGCTVEAARLTGQLLSNKAKEAGLGGKWVFDKSGYLYHGKVAAFADGLREGGVVKC